MTVIDGFIWNSVDHMKGDTSKSLCFAQHFNLVHWQASKTLANCASQPSTQDNSFSQEIIVKYLLLILTVLFSDDSEKNLKHWNVTCSSASITPCSQILISPLLHKSIGCFYLKEFLMNVKTYKFYITFKHK